jgi:hypothetical protein
MFIQEAGTEMTVALEPAVEEEMNIIDFVDMYEELEALERRVMVQRFHIGKVKLEEDGGAYQPQEHLEEVGLEPTQNELKEIKMSEKEGAEWQLRDETIELDSTAEWQSNSIEEENDMGDHDDLPTNKQELQLRRLHKKNQPLDQLDRVI